MKSIHLSFSLLLPLFSLAVWVCLVAVPTSLIYLALESRAADTHLRATTTPPSHLRHLRSAVSFAPRRFGRFIQTVNMPAIAVELPISRLASTWPSVWTPPGFPTDSWRVIIYPIYCLPFWWFAGLGIDGLLKRRYLRLPTCIIGTLFCGFFIFIASGLTFGLSAEDHQGMSHILYGFALWIALFATFPATWFRQRRVARA